MRKQSFAFIILLILFNPLFGQVDLKKLDSYYAKALKDWGVPGMSIAIVKDGKVIFSKGYGVKEIGKPGAPDAHTLFAIASNSKAFTSAVIAQLVEEGKLGWNDKVRKYLPYFELYDPWTSKETTIRDILSHRVGLKTFSGDLIWYRSQLTSEEMIRRVKYLPRAYDFRAGYGYSNLMFITAGEVIKKVTGKEWGEVVHERFFQPLQMPRTITTTRQLETKGNYASPHALFDEEHKPIPWEDWNHVAATGGIISSVNDMSNWMIFNLNHGIWNKDTLFSKTSRNIMWTPHNPFGVDHTDKDHSTHLRGYALGWSVSDYHGKLRVGHTGGYSGMLSSVTLIPDENLGVVILTNGMRSVFGPLTNYTIDAFLKVPQKDWSAEGLANLKNNPDTRIEDRKKARVLDTKPSLPLDAFVGNYQADSYGRISISKEADDLKIQFEHTPDFTATLKHWHYDVWEIKWQSSEVLAWFSFGTVKFELDNNNKVKGISFDVPNNDFWFEELNARKL